MTADRLQELGYAMVIWPVSSLRVANRAQQELYAELSRTGTTSGMLDRMQTRAELYETLDLAGFEDLDTSIRKSVLPTVGGKDDRVR